MNYKEYLLSKKYYLKGLSSAIRTSKLEFRRLAKDKKDTYSKWKEIQKSKYEIRHEHIAYCLIKKTKGNVFNNDKLTNEANKQYVKIESKVNENNEPNFDYIRQLSKEYPVIQEIHNEKIVCPDEE